MGFWEGCDAIERTPGKVSGTWVFSGTRMPVSTLFSILQTNNTLDDFHRWYPGVAEQLVLRLLDHIESSLQGTPGMGSQTREAY